MAKRGAAVGMSGREKVLGGVVLVLYLAVLPWVSGPAFALLERLLGVRLEESVRNAIYYYLLFALVVMLGLLMEGQANLNDAAIAGRIGDAPRSTILMVVFLAPVVEETLFRGYVFGCLREVHRGLAYLASCLLFALLHVWQFAAARGDLTYLLLMVQYLVPGAVMAWTYERSGSLWGSVLLHGVVNGLAVVRVL